VRSRLDGCPLGTVHFITASLPVQNTLDIAYMHMPICDVWTSAPAALAYSDQSQVVLNHTASPCVAIAYIVKLWFWWLWLSWLWSCSPNSCFQMARLVPAPDEKFLQALSGARHGMANDILRSESEHMGI
jgi:hypothetical protein